MGHKKLSKLIFQVTKIKQQLNLQLLDEITLIELFFPRVTAEVIQHHNYRSKQQQQYWMVYTNSSETVAFKIITKTNNVPAPSWTVGHVS